MCYIRERNLVILVTKIFPRFYESSQYKESKISPKEVPCFTLSEFGKHVLGRMIFFQFEVNRAGEDLLPQYDSYNGIPWHRS